MLTLSEESICWALTQALNFGDTDVFPKLFEFDAIKYKWDDIKKWILNENILGWCVRPARRCLTPKHVYGFRVSTQLDPIDFLIFSALIYEIGDDLEKSRVSVTEEIVHSYRFEQNANGQMFSKSPNYETFMDKSRELAQQSFDWVVTADIADFFPRLYSHRIKNALLNVTKKNNHAEAIEHLLSGWNESYSYGIPVGSSASRLLAEVAINDVDSALLSEGTTYVRFSDDFRIFCKSKREAYNKLSFLANVLFENHGLTLQQHKTKIMTKEAYKKSYLSTEKEEELKRLSKAFNGLVDELGLGSIYEEIEWDDLTEEQQQKISELNLSEIIEEQIELEEIAIPLTRFVLQRLAQIGSCESLEPVIKNIDKLYPIIPDVVRYIKALRELNPERKNEIGGRILDLLDSSIISHLEFHRMWLLSLFTDNTEYDHQKRFSQIFSQWSDQFTQREAILSLGRSKQDSWFRTRKRNVFNFPPWLRRTFLIAGSCMPQDERRHWYNSLGNRLDPLELAVTQFALQKPYG